MKSIPKLLLRGVLTTASMLCASTLLAADVGLWDFNSSNLTATPGSTLGDLSYADGTTAGFTTFGTTTSFGIANIGGSPASIMKFPGATNGMGFRMPTPPANGAGGSTVNQYTFIMDVFYPTASSGKTRPLIQTSDGVFLGSQEFIVIDGASGGVGPLKIGSGGVNGPYVGSIQPNTWYRLGISVSAPGTIHIYTNGIEMGSFDAGSLDGFFALNPSSTALILADTSTNAAPGYVNSVQLRDTALSSGQMQALGGPSAAGIPLVIPPVPSFVASRNPGLNATGIKPFPAIEIVLDQGDTVINSSSIQISLDGVNLATTVNATAPTYTADATVATALEPLSIHTVSVAWTDNTVGAKSSTWQFTVQPYQVLTLPTPFYFENFDSVAETAFPTNFYQTNNTETDHAGFSLTDPESDTYKGWVVISTSTLQTAKGGDPLLVPPISVNGSFLTAMANGNLCYAESDSRGGSQVQMLFATNINCTGRSNVFLSFHSIYQQNQDNIGSVEYSIDNGVNWLPCVYMLDDQNQTADVIRTNGVVDVGATFNTPRTDQAYGLAYGTWIGAPVTAALIPYVSGRINDDNIESIRVEVFRLAQADNAPSVSLRFMQAGTASWWFGIDEVGLYEITTPVFTQQPQNAIIAAGTGTNFTVAVSSPTPVTYQWQHAATNISNGGHYSGVNTAVLTVSNASTNEVGQYRCRVSNNSGPVTSSSATLGIIAAPLIIQQPISQAVNPGVTVSLTTLVRGRPPLVYQWTKGAVPVGGATSSALIFPNAQAANAGLYACIISNSDAVVTSTVASVKVVSSITDDLVVHLKFDSDFKDSSGRGNNGTAVGAPTLVPGKIGQCMQYTDADSGASANYVTLGIPPDLHMTNNTSFSIAFWYKVPAGNRHGDPAMVSNKDWDSGGNTGFTIWSQGDGFRWNYTEVNDGVNLNSRKDSGATPPTIEDGNWHHCAATFNRGGNVGLYVDGQLKQVSLLASPNLTYGGFFWPTTIDNDPPNPRTRTATGAWNIGEDGSGLYTSVGGGHDGPGISVTNACIDDVGIWRRTLTPNEVLAVYNAGNAGASLDTATLVANPHPLDPTITASPTAITVNKGNAMLFSAPAINGPWTEITAARGTNVYVELPGPQKFFRGGQP
jgi:hypothetical protein